MFPRMLFAALLALTTENLLFTGGAGFSRALRAVRRPRAAGLFAAFVTWFSLISALVGAKLLPLLPDFGLGQTERLAVLDALCAAAAYLATAFLLRRLLPRRYGEFAPMLAPAAANTLVLAMPFVRQTFGFSFSEAVGYALGTGAAFFLAEVVLSHAMEKSRNPDAPRAFSGLPAALLYIGILSMAFAGLTGTKVFS